MRKRERDVSDCMWNHPHLHFSIYPFLRVPFLPLPPSLPPFPYLGVGRHIDAQGARDDHTEEGKHGSSAVLDLLLGKVREG